MRKRDFYVTIFWIALGVFVSAFAYIKLGVGKFNAHGSGLMPFLLGIIFSLLASYKLVMALLNKHGESEKPQTEEEETEQSPTLYRRLALIVGALFAYALLLEPLGFLPTTFLTMVVLFQGAGFKRWIVSAAYSGGVVLITYFLFTYLGVRFPPGILRALGLY